MRIDRPDHGPGARAAARRHGRAVPMIAGLMLAAPLIWLASQGDAVAAPAIFWANDPVGPDQSVVVTGDQFLSATGVVITLVPRDRQASAPSRQLPLQQLSATSAKFTIPADFPAGVYRYEIKTPFGDAGGMLNQPTVYWIAGDAGATATPGGWIRVLGRNIQRKERAALTLSGPGKPPRTLPIEAGDLWDGRVTLPADLAAGRYDLRLDNGDSPAGGSAIGAFEVRAAPPRPKATEFDVRTFGAVGDGKADDTQAIQTALNAAGADSAQAPQRVAQVTVPDGIYLVSGTLTVPPGVALRGTSTARSVLVWPDTAEPLPAMIAGETDFAVERLTVYASNHGDIVVGGVANRQPIAGAKNIAIRDIRIRASAYRGHMVPKEAGERNETLNKLFFRTPSSIRLSGSNLDVVNNDVVGSGGSLVVIGGTDARISGNRLANGRQGWYSITCSTRVIAEDNEFYAADLQGTGGSVNTLSTSCSTSENVLFKNNYYHDIYGWDREALTTDGALGYYYGNVQPIGPSELALTSDLPTAQSLTNWVGATMFVIDGRGEGQWAKVKAWEPPVPGTSGAGKVTLETPLAVAPNVKSVVTITQTQRNYLFIGNRFVDTGVAAQTYGVALDHVFAGNSSVRTGGFIVRGSHYRHFQPDWHVQVLGNEIIEGSIYRAGSNHSVFAGKAVFAVRGLPNGNRLPPYAQSIIVRDNKLAADAQIELTGRNRQGASEGSRQQPGVRDVIVENNSFAGAADIVADDGIVGQLIRNNVSRPPQR